MGTYCKVRYIQYSSRITIEHFSMEGTCLIIWSVYASRKLVVFYAWTWLFRWSVDFSTVHTGARKTSAVASRKLQITAEREKKLSRQGWKTRRPNHERAEEEKVLGEHGPWARKRDNNRAIITNRIYSSKLLKHQNRRNRQAIGFPQNEPERALSLPKFTVDQKGGFPLIKSYLSGLRNWWVFLFIVWLRSSPCPPFFLSSPVVIFNTGQPVTKQGQVNWRGQGLSIVKKRRSWSSGGDQIREQGRGSGLGRSICQSDRGYPQNTSCK